MAVKVAINGFGRIGRLAFRQMFGAEGYEVVAINDLTSPKMLAHLLKYDSSQGKYALADTVTSDEDSITVDGKNIKIYAFPDANNCPWGELGVDVVLECSGFYTSKAKAQACCISFAAVFLGSFLAAKHAAGKRLPAALAVAGCCIAVCFLARLLFFENSDGRFLPIVICMFTPALLAGVLGGTRKKNSRRHRR